MDGNPLSPLVLTNTKMFEVFKHGLSLFSRPVLKCFEKKFFFFFSGEEKQRKRHLNSQELHDRKYMQ